MFCTITFQLIVILIMLIAFFGLRSFFVLCSVILIFLIPSSLCLISLVLCYSFVKVNALSCPFLLPLNFLNPFIVTCFRYSIVSPMVCSATKAKSWSRLYINTVGHHSHSAAPTHHKHSRPIISCSQSEVRGKCQQLLVKQRCDWLDINSADVMVRMSHRSIYKGSSHLSLMGNVKYGGGSDVILIQIKIIHSSP